MSRLALWVFLSIHRSRHGRWIRRRSNQRGLWGRLCLRVKALLMKVESISRGLGPACENAHIDHGLSVKALKERKELGIAKRELHRLWLDFNLNVTLVWFLFISLYEAAKAVMALRVTAGRRRLAVWRRVAILKGQPARLWLLVWVLFIARRRGARAAAGAKP
jgi:hypothetical protein